MKNLTLSTIKITIKDLVTEVREMLGEIAGTKAEIIEGTHQEIHLIEAKDTLMMDIRQGENNTKVRIQGLLQDLLRELVQDLQIGSQEGLERTHSKKLEFLNTKILT